VIIGKQRQKDFGKKDETFCAAIDNFSVPNFSVILRDVSLSCIWCVLWFSIFMTTKDTNHTKEKSTNPRLYGALVELYFEIQWQAERPPPAPPC
jgi:hypothetical protein